uniref:PseudoU_synth_2 domain-containing protein n=2 Tax=Rhabditophanes sp. KR3021 TaxID=114890 RepID=A0AC35THU5_9BILA
MKGKEYVDDVFGIKYDAEEKESPSDTFYKELGQQSLNTSKDDFFTEQIILKAGGNKENIRHDVMEDDKTDFFTEQILKNRCSDENGHTIPDKPNDFIKNDTDKDFSNRREHHIKKEYRNNRNSDNEYHADKRFLKSNKFANGKSSRKEFTKKETQSTDKQDYDFFATKKTINRKDEGNLKVISEPIFAEGDYGIEVIRGMIDTVWKCESKEKLADIMGKRVIYEDDSLIAFDKPYFLAYSGTPREGNMNMDSCLQELKTKLWPDIDRLHLVKSLDKQYSGVILFAKSDSEKLRYQEMGKEGSLLNKYYTLVRGIPDEGQATIKFPLVKIEKSKKHSKVQVFHAESDYRVIETNKRANMCFMEVNIKNDFTHQIRSHLSYGLNCPLIGDYKYNPLNTGGVLNPPKFTNDGLNLLDIGNRHSYKKVPMLCHLGKMSFENQGKGFVIEAPMPAHMKYVLKKLKLLKR